MTIKRLFSPKTKKLKNVVTRIGSRARPRAPSRSPDLVTSSINTMAVWPAFSPERIKNDSKRKSNRFASSVTYAPQHRNKQIQNKIYTLPQLYDNSLTAQSVAAIPNETTLVCAIRAERKEVLFATGKAGKAGQKTKKLKPSSKIRCY